MPGAIYLVIPARFGARAVMGNVTITCTCALSDPGLTFLADGYVCQAPRRLED